MRVAARHFVPDRAFALAVVLVGSLVLLVYANRHAWFGGDEWFILIQRRLVGDRTHLGVFDAHNEHWATLPILTFRILYATVGLTTYWPYLALALVVHGCIAVLLWVVMVRAGVAAWLATAACAVFAVLGIGFENLMSGWQAGFIAPLALGLAAIVVAPAQGSFTRRDAVASALMVLAMACSGVAIPMLVSLALVTFVRRGWRVCAATVVAPVVAYAVWYVGWGRASPRTAPLSPGSVPSFVWRGLTHAFGHLLRIDALGPVVVIAVLAWVAWRLTRRPFDQRIVVPGALALGSALFLASVGWSRGELFSADPAASRYAYVTIAFALPLVLVAVQHVADATTATRAVALVIAVVLVVAQGRLLLHELDAAAPGKRSDRGAFLASALLARERHPFLLERPLYAFEPQVTVADIVAMDHDGKLPALDVRTVDRLTVLTRLDLFVGPTPLVPTTGALATVIAMRHARSNPGATPGCIDLIASTGGRAVLRTTGRSALELRGEGVVGLQLRDRRSMQTGDIVYFQLGRGRVQYLSVGAIEGDIVMSLPPGTTSVCGLGR